MRILILVLFAALLPAQQVRFIGKTKYLNNARAVVVHSIDDSTKYVPDTVDLMDKYGIKATIFVSTEFDPAPEDRFFTQLQVRDLWPRLRKAIDDGHEVGSHSRQHTCKKPDDETFCASVFNDYEVKGSRDDILRLTQQPYVWSWCYPCGNCATYPFVQERVAAAGYLVARNYPNELTNGHVRPDVQDFDTNLMNAGYTQTVQHRNSSRDDSIDLPSLNSKFDEVHAKGGIYHFMSHPQWLDYGPGAFYEAHLQHVGKRRDVWYVPMGLLYAFRAMRDQSTVKPLAAGSFSVSNTLDPKIYSGTITLEFEAPPGTAVLSSGRLLAEQGDALTDRWDREYVRRDGEHLFVTARSNTKIEFFTPKAPEDASGTWKLTYRTRNGLERESSLVLKQSGNQIAGTLSGSRGNAPITSGQIESGRLLLHVDRIGNNDDVPVAITGAWNAEVLHLGIQFRGAEPIAATAKR